MVNKIKSVFIWIGIASVILLWYPLVALIRLFDRKDPTHYRTGKFFRKIGFFITKVNPNWKISVSGNFPENPRNPYVVVCNHLSHADVPIISRLPWDMKWVAKKELFSVPIVGRMMRFAGDIPVDRKAKDRMVSTLKKTRFYLTNKCSVMFFPEGTRSKTGNIMRFTDGAFILAIRNQVPILPLALDGSRDCLPKHSWVFNKISTIHLHVFDPIDTVGMTMDDVELLKSTIRTKIIEKVAEFRNVSPSDVDGVIAEPAI